MGVRFPFIQDKQLNFQYFGAHLSMGLFDAFKGKRAQTSDDGPSPHYALAHHALRQLALENPLVFLAVLASPDAKEFLAKVLADVCEACDRQPTFSADEIKIHSIKVQEYPCVVLEFPEPRECAEAHMVALVLPANEQQLRSKDSKSLSGRYFTLEKGFSLEGHAPRTVLAEWTEQSHENYGDGPKVDVGALGNALAQIV